jgi:hypothetical protein
LEVAAVGALVQQPIVQNKIQHWLQFAGMPVSSLPLTLCCNISDTGTDMPAAAVMPISMTAIGGFLIDDDRVQQRKALVTCTLC